MTEYMDLALYQGSKTPQILINKVFASYPPFYEYIIEAIFLLLHFFHVQSNIRLRRGFGETLLNPFLPAITSPL